MQLDRLQAALSKIIDEDTGHLRIDPSVELPTFSAEQLRQLDGIEAVKLAVLWGIARQISMEVGRGELSTLDESSFHDAVRDACDAIENWEYDGDLRNVTPRTPLQLLLAKHCDLEGQILDLEGAAMN